MQTKRSMSQKQIDYISLLDKQIKDHEIDFELPLLFKEKLLSEKAASKLIQEMKELLGKEAIRVLSQVAPWKNISNIYIKKEWVIDWDYKKNSILASIPFIDDVTGESKNVECRFPKGGRFVDRYDEKTKEFKKVFVKELIYNVFDVKVYNKKIKNDYLACGINMNWLGWFRYITNYENEVDITEKMCFKWNDCFDIFEQKNNEYVTELRKVVNVITKAFYDAKRRRERLDHENAKNGKANDHDKKIEIKELTDFDNWALPEVPLPFVKDEDPPPERVYSNKIESLNTSEIGVDDDAILFDD